MAAPQLVDIDDVDDLARVAVGIPNSRTAAAARTVFPHLLAAPRPAELSAYGDPRHSPNGDPPHSPAHDARATRGGPHAARRER